MLHFGDKYKCFKTKQDAYAYYNSKILDACKVTTSTRSDAGLAVLAGVSASFVSLIRKGDKLIPYSCLCKWIQFIADECTLSFIELAYQDSMMISVYWNK